MTEKRKRNLIERNKKIKVFEKKYKKTNILFMDLQNHSPEYLYLKTLYSYILLQNKKDDFEYQVLKIFNNNSNQDQTALIPCETFEQLVDEKRYEQIRRSIEEKINDSDLPERNKTSKIINECLFLLLNELTENAIIHGKSKFSFYCCYLIKEDNLEFDQTPYIELIIADTGKGISKTLEKKLPINYKIDFSPRNRNIIRKYDKVSIYSLDFYSTSDKISRAKRIREICESANIIEPEKIATGLFCSLNTVKNFKGKLLLRTGTSLISLDFFSNPGSYIFFHSKDFTDKQMDFRLKSLQGTVISIKIPILETNPYEIDTIYRKGESFLGYDNIKCLNPIIAEPNISKSKILDNNFESISNIVKENNINKTTIIVPIFTDQFTNKEIAIFMAFAQMHSNQNILIIIHLHNFEEIKASEFYEKSNKMLSIIVGNITNNIFYNVGIGIKETFPLIIIENNFSQKFSFEEDYIISLKKVLNNKINSFLTNRINNKPFLITDKFLLQNKYYLDEFYFFNKLEPFEEITKLIAYYFYSKIMNKQINLVINTERTTRNIAEELLTIMNKNNNLNSKLINSYNRNELSQLIISQSESFQCVLITDVICTGDSLKSIIEQMNLSPIKYICTIVDARKKEFQNTTFSYKSRKIFEQKINIIQVMGNTINVYKDYPDWWDKNERILLINVKKEIINADTILLRKNLIQLEKYNLTGHTIHLSTHFLACVDFRNYIIKEKKKFISWFNDRLDSIRIEHNKEQAIIDNSNIKEANMHYQEHYAFIKKEINSNFDYSYLANALINKGFNKIDIEDYKEISNYVDVNFSANKELDSLHKPKIVICLSFIDEKEIEEIINCLENFNIKEIFIISVFSKTANRKRYSSLKIQKFGNMIVKLIFWKELELDTYYEYDCPVCKYKQKINETKMYLQSRIIYLDLIDDNLRNQYIQLLGSRLNYFDNLIKEKYEVFSLYTNSLENDVQSRKRIVDMFQGNEDESKTLYEVVNLLSISDSFNKENLKNILHIHYPEFRARYRIIKEKNVLSYLFLLMKIDTLQFEDRIRKELPKIDDYSKFFDYCILLLFYENYISFPNLTKTGYNKLLNLTFKLDYKTIKYNKPLFSNEPPLNTIFSSVHRSARDFKNEVELLESDEIDYLKLGRIYNYYKEELLLPYYDLRLTRYYQELSKSFSEFSDFIYEMRGIMDSVLQAKIDLEYGKIDKGNRIFLNKLKQDLGRSYELCDKLEEYIINNFMTRINELPKLISWELKIKNERKEIKILLDPESKNDSSKYLFFNQYYLINNIAQNVIFENWSKYGSIDNNYEITGINEEEYYKLSFKDDLTKIKYEVFESSDGGFRKLRERCKIFHTKLSFIECEGNHIELRIHKFKFV